MLLADRGYNADWIRSLGGRERRMGQHPATVQSQRTDLLQPLISIEPGIWSSGSSAGSSTARRVATRYDKLAANYLAFVQLASIRLWLRANESTA
jgi:transposase